MITPRVPSDPQNSRSTDGPAPEPGTRRVCTTPLAPSSASGEHSDLPALVEALMRGDGEFADAALRMGDTRVVAGWLANAVKCLDEDRAASVLAGFRDLARPGDGWCAYEAELG